MQHPAGELQIFLRAKRQQIPHKPYMARADIGAGFQYAPDIQQQRSRILGGGHVDHQRLARHAGVRLRKDAAGADAAQDAVIAPHVSHFNDDPAGEHHADLLRGNPLRENNLALLKGVLLRVQATEHFLNVRRLHSAKKPCVC